VSILVPTTNPVVPLSVQVVAETQLPLVARIAYAGRWLDLQDEDSGYCLGSDTLSSATAGFHSNDSTSPYVQGTYSSGIQADDVTETVSVWCVGQTTFGVRSRRQLLIDAFSQPTYQMFWRVEDAAEMWDCRFASLSRNTQKEYLHDRRELLTFSVPRKPNARPVLASMDES
jgi:hypothetical protein